MEYVDTIVAVIQGEDVDIELRIHVIVLIVVEIIIRLGKFGKCKRAQVADTTPTSTATSTSSSTANVQNFQLDYDCFIQLQSVRHIRQLILPCMNLLQVRDIYCFY